MAKSKKRRKKPHNKRPQRPAGRAIPQPAAPAGAGKAVAKPGQAKQGQARGAATNAKAGQAKPGQAKTGQARGATNAKPGQAKPGQAKPGEAKAGQAKAGQARGATTVKPGQAKPGQARPGATPANVNAGAIAGPGQARAKAGQVRSGKAELRSPAPRTGTARWLVGAVVLVAMVAGLAAIVANRSDEADGGGQAVTPGICTEDTEFDGDAGAGQNHVDDPTYTVDPPAGGDHLANPARPGRYTEADLPPDGELVHAMEHGFVVLWHRPDLPEADRKTVDALVAEFSQSLVVVPRPSLVGPVAATVWHRRTLCGAGPVDRAALSAFITNYRDQGPEKGLIGRRAPVS